MSELLEEGCVKTGCHVFLTEYGEWIYGDAFLINKSMIIRCCDIKRQPICDVLHITIPTIAHWWDRNITSVEFNSTLIAKTFTWHGYDGVPNDHL